MITIWIHHPCISFLATSFLDLCYSTVTTLSFWPISFDNEKLIPYGQCIVQLFFLHVVGAAETAPAHSDGLWSLCCNLSPALYHLYHESRIMLCVGSCLLDGRGFVHSTVQTILTARLPFLGPNQVDNFFVMFPLSSNLPVQTLLSLNC